MGLGMALVGLAAIGAGGGWSKILTEEQRGQVPHLRKATRAQTVKLWRLARATEIFAGQIGRNDYAYALNPIVTRLRSELERPFHRFPGE